MDLTVRKKAGRITGSASVFYYHFKDFVTAQPTGLFAEGEDGEEGLPIFIYRATDANFLGGEIQATWHILQPVVAEAPQPAGKGPEAKTNVLPSSLHALDFTVGTDYVWAQDTQTDRSLPRITPLRAGAELSYTWNDRFNARVEGQYVARQNRTAEFELPTDSYFLLNASISYKVPVGAVDLDFYVRGTNLTDDEARMHTSFLKDIAPLPGRGVLLGVKATF